MKYYAWPQCFPQETERKVMFIFKCFNLLHFETEIKRLDLRRTFCFCKQFNHEHIQDFPRFLEGFRCCCCGQITSYPEEVLWRKTVKIYYHHNIYKKKKNTCRMQFSTLHSVMWNNYAQWWSNCNLLKYNFIRIAKKNIWWKRRSRWRDQNWDYPTSCRVWYQLDCIFYLVRTLICSVLYQCSYRTRTLSIVLFLFIQLR